MYCWQHPNKLTGIISSISFGQDLSPLRGGDMSLRCTHPSALSHTALSQGNGTWPRSALFPKTLEHVHKQLINPEMNDDLAQEEEEERSVMLSCSRKGKQQVPRVVLGMSLVSLELLWAPHTRPVHSHSPQRQVGLTHSSKSLRPQCVASRYQLDQFN